MIEKFRNKLKDNGQSLTWFHRTFIRKLPGKQITYSYFVMMINDIDRMNNVVKSAIEKFVNGK